MSSEGLHIWPPDQEDVPDQEKAREPSHKILEVDPRAIASDILDGRREALKKHGHNEKAKETINAAAEHMFMRIGQPRRFDETDEEIQARADREGAETRETTGRNLVIAEQGDIDASEASEVVIELPRKKGITNGVEWEDAEFTDAGAGPVDLDRVVPNDSGKETIIDAEFEPIDPPTPEKPLITPIEDGESEFESTIGDETDEFASLRPQEHLFEDLDTPLSDDDAFVDVSNNEFGSGSGIAATNTYQEEEEVFTSPSETTTGHEHEHESHGDHRHEHTGTDHEKGTKQGEKGHKQHSGNSGGGHGTHDTDHGSHDPHHGGHHSKGFFGGVWSIFLGVFGYVWHHIEYAAKHTKIGNISGGGGGGHKKSGGHGGGDHH